MNLSYYALSALVNLFTSLILGGLVFVGHKKNKGNHAFLFFSLAIAFWSFGYYFWQIANNEASALFWTRFLMAGAIFIPVTYLHFVYDFLDLTKKRSRFLKLSYFVFFIFLFLNITPLFVSSVSPILDFKFWPQPGPAFHIFLLAWAFYVIYTTSLLFNGYLKSTGIKHQQLGIVLIGMVLGYFGGSTNYFLWYSLPVLPLGNIFVSFYVLSVAYAVIKFKFLDVKVIATQVIAVSLSLIVLTDVFSAKSTLDLIIRISIFAITSIFAVLLIQLVLGDISRREKMEILSKDLRHVTNNLKRANEKLKRIDQAKLEFLSIASHQLRTPLTVIKGYVSMILEGSFGKVPKLIKTNLAKIYAANERLISLVENLLNISRMEAGRLEFNMVSANLVDIVKPLISEYEKKAKIKKIKFNFVVNSNVSAVLIDIDRIIEVIRHFIDNAIKYTDDGNITIEIFQKKNLVVFTCRDTGRGISSEKIPSIFNRFIQKNNASMSFSESNGLDLYFSKMIVENMNGKIWVESDGENKGSNFSFSIPVV